MIKKVLNIAKLVLQMMLVMVIGCTISLGIHMSVRESLLFPSYSELASLDNVSDDLSAKESAAVVRSRQSILQVLSATSNEDGFAKMSGTYMEHQGKFYVLTAAHGIIGECDHMFVATASDLIYDCVRYIIVDRYVDYALIQIEEVTHRTPVQLSHVVPRGRGWKEETAVLSEVFYTGYPNGLGPLTFRGSIAGLSDEAYLYIHSYAWPGSSGSGMFSDDGNLIGILIALNVGFTGAGYDVLEDLVIVTPLFMIDWDTAYEIMDEAPPSGDTGDTGE